MIDSDVKLILEKLKRELPNVPTDCGCTIFVELSDSRLARIRFSTAHFEEPKPLKEN